MRVKKNKKCTKRNIIETEISDYENHVRGIMYMKNVVCTYLFSFLPHGVRDRNENNHAISKSAQSAR